MNCKHCGAELQSDAIFCTQCGKAVESPEQGNVVEEVRSESFEDFAQKVTQEVERQESQAQNVVYDNTREQGSTPSQTQGYTGGSFQQQSQMPPQQTGNPPNVPPGYTLDPRNGLYFISDVRNNPQTGQPSQYVTYFNAQTGETFNAYYPLTPEQQQKHAMSSGGGQAGYYPAQQPAQKKKVWPILLVIGISVLLIVGVIIAVVFGIRSAANKDVVSEESSVSDRDDERTSLRDRDKDEDEEEEPAVAAVEELQPIVSKSGDKNDWMNFPQNSFSYADAGENEDYVYFINSMDKEETSQYLYRLDKNTGKLEKVVDAGDERAVYNFCIAGDYVIFNTLAKAYDGGYDFDSSASYYWFNSANDEFEYLFTKAPEQMALYDGFVYILLDEEMTLRKLGLDSDGDFDYEDESINLNTYGYIYDENMSIVDGIMYINTLYSSNEILYTYDIEKQVGIEVYRGDDGVQHDKMFMHNEDIFYLDSGSVEGKILIQQAKLGETGSANTLYTHSSEKYTYGFLARVDNVMYYLQGEEVFVANFGDLKNGIKLFDAESYPYAVTENYIIMEDHFYEIRNDMVLELPSASGSALVAPDGSSTSSSSTYSSSEYFSPYEYEGPVIFSDDAENVFETIGYAFPELEEDMGTSYIDPEFMMIYARAYLQNETLYDLIVDKDGKVDVPLLKTMIYDFFIADYDSFEGMLYNGEVAGFTIKGEDVYIDESWKPAKTITKVTSEIIIAGDQCDVTVTYSDGKSQTISLYYYESSSALMSQYHMYYMLYVD